uniref:Fibronectin type-III domain-containing protein n=1 Tax=Mola mola TaxID=94237 RepID=A0A3Q4BAF0_MOLML
RRRKQETCICVFRKTFDSSLLISPLSAPCSPSIQNSTLICHTNSSSLSWMPMADATGYVVNATATNGHAVLCSSATATCTLTDLLCSETYTATITARGGQCDSAPSSSTSIITCECARERTYLPSRSIWTMMHFFVCFFHATLICLDHSALVSWLGSHRAVGYNVTMTGQDGHTHRFQTNATSCQLPDIHCGETYGITVTPYSDTCAGRPSAVYTNITVSPVCEDTTVSWSHVPGAEMFIAIATADDGHNHTCRSNHSNSCNFTSLHCGQTYAVTVVTVDRGCWSQPSSPVERKTGERNLWIFNHKEFTLSPIAPCLPDDVLAELQCNTNVMNVSWTQTPGSDNYTAWAISPDGHRECCNSTSNTCHIHGLQCGKTYEVAVTSSSVNCEIISVKHTIVIDGLILLQPPLAPCKPENISVDQNCSTSVMTVKWKQSSTSQNYTVKATSVSGVNATCDSTESSCSFLDMSCGQLYTFTVMGHTYVCISETNTPIEKLTGIFENKLATLLAKILHYFPYINAAADTGYSVQATSISGHNSSCSEMGTSCHLNNLACGQEYSVYVNAIHTGCPGPASRPATLTTGEHNSSVAVFVLLTQVMWEAGRGASSYSVQAVTDQGVMVTCNTTNTSCSLNGLKCGHIFNVSVAAHNRACDSVSSRTHRLMTG